MTNSERIQKRTEIIAACLEMNATGLNQGTSGNISQRSEDGILITPSGMPYGEMSPEDIVLFPDGSANSHYEGSNKPSSEWRFHLAIYDDRPEINAVVHTHSRYATALSMLRLDIPAVHYMIAVFGGPTIRCANYAIFGSEELSQHAVAALKDRTGCLLGTHGMIVCGKSLKDAMWRATELETLAAQYALVLQMGREPVILSDEHIYEVRERIEKGYGIWEASD